MLLGFCIGLAHAQSPEEPKQGPVEAEFLAHFNVRHMTPGGRVFARVTSDWTGPNCVLRQGSILEGNVELAEPRVHRSESRLALSFKRAQCNGTEMQPLDLLLAAVADAPLNWSMAPDSQFSMPMSFSNPHGNGMPGFGAAGIGDQYTGRLELTGIVHRFPMRPDMKPGTVIGIRGYKLDIGTGPNQSSVLSSRIGDVSLGAFTQLLLVPKSSAFKTSTVVLVRRKREAGEASDSANVRPEPEPNSSNLDTCAPPGCAVDLPVSAQELQGHSAGSIPLRPLGYVPRSHMILDAFVDEEALAWLGSNELLFTFNPHRLIKRSRPGQPSQARLRVVRAVLLDTQTRAIIRAVDWEIADSRQYLWQLNAGRVLAHIGNELRIYDSGLQVVKTVPLAGPLSFVRISPDANLLAVGVLRERHPEDLHASLRESTGREPEEDVDVSVLDKDFNTIGHASTVSGLLPPTLLNEGQVKLLARANNAYRLAMNNWENKETTLAHFTSLCTPELSSMAPDLLFLMSCNEDGRPEYRILGADGKMLLRGKSIPRELGQEVVGSDGSNRFAMKVVYADRELSAGEAFKRSELESEQIRVYESGHGKRLVTLHVDDPPTSHNSFALSPDGTQLAALSGLQVKLFAIAAQ